MIDIAAYWFATSSPLGLFAILACVFLLGFAVGLAGYADARRAAVRDLVAAHQRGRLAMIEARQ